jgi:RNA polymerase sigma-70 factor, ECF subfamily
MKDEFEQIVRNESQKLYGLSFRLTGNPQEAEDLCQEALARAYKSFHKFEGRSQVSTWLFRIVVNAWKNKLRAKRPFTILGFLRNEEDEIINEPAGKDPAPEAGMERAQSDQILQDALLTISKDEREIIVLRDLEEKSYEEIGDLLRIPLGTVKSRLARAREALRLKLVPLLRARGEFS